MNKGDLINDVAMVFNTKKEAKIAVDSIFSAFVKSLKKKDTITIAGFGTFKVIKRKARMGINPQTGEAIKIKAKNVLRFMAGTSLKDTVNGNKKSKKAL